MQVKSIKSFFFIIFAFISGFSYCDVFNKKLSDKELESLKNGEVLIRNIGSASKICIDSDNEFAEKSVSIIKKLHPSYLMEVIQIRKCEKNENLIENLSSILLDIPSYKGIPYYSEHNKIWVDLYSEANVLSHEKNGETEKMVADLFMIPFDNIKTSIILTQTKDSLFYISENTEKIYYDNIPCINIGNLKSIITVFKYGDYYILYGIGGVAAPKVPFLTKRIELSFMNRIKTFCNFVYNKI